MLIWIWKGRDSGERSCYSTVKIYICVCIQSKLRQEGHIADESNCSKSNSDKASLTHACRRGQIVAMPQQTVGLLLMQLLGFASSFEPRSRRHVRPLEKNIIRRCQSCVWNTPSWYLQLSEEIIVWHLVLRTQEALRWCCDVSYESENS